MIYWARELADRLREERIVVRVDRELEPGLYRDGFGGCRLEDLVLVGDTCGHLLTDFPYSMVP